MSDKLLMKRLLPNGRGAFLVLEFVKNTEEGAAQLRDTLLAAGDFADATQEEYDNFVSATDAVAGVLLNEEWAPVHKLDEEQRALVRGALAGDFKLAKAEAPVETASDVA